MPALTVPTTGPRSRGDAAPQRIGKRVAMPVRPGWEVSRIWVPRLVLVIVLAPCCTAKAISPPPTRAEREASRSDFPTHMAKEPGFQAFAAATSARARLPSSAAERPGL